MHIWKDKLVENICQSIDIYLGLYTDSAAMFIPILWLIIAAAAILSDGIICIFRPPRKNLYEYRRYYIYIAYLTAFLFEINFISKLTIYEN